MRVPENRFEFAKQGGALLAFRDQQRHPSPPSTENSTELKTEKSKTPSLRQIHLSALFLVHLHFEFRQLLPKALFNCLPKPFIEVDLTEQRRNQPTLWDALLSGRLQHQFQELQYLWIIDPLRHFPQHDMMFHR